MVPTGHMHAIRSDTGEQLDGVYALLLERTRGDRVEYAGSGPRLEHLQELLDRYRGELAEIQAQGPRQGRRMGEDALTDDQVQRRRIREHQLALQRAAGRAAGVREEIASVQQRRLALYAQIESALHEALAQGERISGRAEQRIAFHLKGAARSHPDPAALTRASAGLGTTDRDWLAMTSAADLMAALEEDR